MTGFFKKNIYKRESYASGQNLISFFESNYNDENKVKTVCLKLNI